VFAIIICHFVANSTNYHNKTRDFTLAIVLKAFEQLTYEYRKGEEVFVDIL
jgi:hypothetical protein